MLLDIGLPGRDEDRARCLAVGFDDHVTKPIDPPLLQRLLAMPRVRARAS